MSAPLSFTVRSELRGQYFYGLVGVRYPMYRAVVTGIDQQQCCPFKATYFDSGWMLTYEQARYKASMFMTSHDQAGAD